MKRMEALAGLGVALVLALFMAVAAEEFDSQAADTRVKGCSDHPLTKHHTVKMDTTPKLVRECWEVDLQLTSAINFVGDIYPLRINGVICEKVQ